MHVRALYLCVKMACFLDWEHAPNVMASILQLLHVYIQSRPQGNQGAGGLLASQLCEPRSPTLHCLLLTTRTPTFWLLQLLREHRSDGLAKMQLEMECVMEDVSRDFDAADARDGDGDDRSPSGSDSGSVCSALSSAAAEEDCPRGARETGDGLLAGDYNDDDDRASS
jgi:hypothetical protein